MRVWRATANGAIRPPTIKEPATMTGFVMTDGFLATVYINGPNSAVAIQIVLGIPIFFVLRLSDRVTFHSNKKLGLLLTIFGGAVQQWSKIWACFVPRGSLNQNACTIHESVVVDIISISEFVGLWWEQEL